MARQLRIEYANALHHVTSRGNERQPIFRSDDDRRAFLLFLGTAAVRFGWSISAWVLMTNHFHLVIRTPNPNLSRGMHWLNTKYAGWFNRKYHRSGHLFQGRFHNVLVESETYFRRLLRYVVLNPVHAGMEQRPEDHLWSSYRATAGLEEAPEWFDLAAALAAFGEGTEAQTAYRLFVETGIDEADCLWDELTNQIYLGSEGWTKEVRARVESKPRSSDMPRIQRAVGRPKMAHIVDAVARAAKVSTEVLRSKQGRELRRLSAWLGWNEGLLTLRSIAAGLRLQSEGYVSNLIRQCEREFLANRELLAHRDAATVSLRA
jgi:putative transposase